MNHFFQRRKFAVGSLLFSALIIMSGCSEAPLKPASIGPNDVCYYCKEAINEKEMIYAAEFIAKDGFVRKFDDIGCLVKMANKVGSKKIKVIYAVDIISRNWFPSDQLQFVRSDKIRTPRNGGIVAFKDVEEAKKRTAQFQPEFIKLSDLIK
jgi:hypothetical protein